jgi:hypothetical protein
MHREDEMQRDGETEHNDKPKRGQEDARGEAAGNVTTRCNALHYNQLNKAGAARGEDAAKRRYDTR